VSPWIKDLDYFAQELPRRHVDPFSNISEEEFLEAIDDLKKDVPHLREYEIVVSLMKIVASIGDSHTMLSADNTNLFRSLPLELEWFNDGIYVIKAAPDYGQLVGKRVVEIGNKSVEEATDLVKVVIPHENDAQLRRRVPGYLMIPEILAALAIVDNLESVTYKFDSIGDITLTPQSTAPDSSWISVHADITCDAPLYLRYPLKYYWFISLNENRTIYAQYNACIEMKNNPFEAFSKGLLAAIDSNQPDKLVFDMRMNGGGTSSIADPLIEAIKQRPTINSKGHLFVVLGGRTFSSAILNALKFKNQTEAIFVGEPTGGRPNHHGEIKLFVLPKSWIVISYSTKYFTHSSEDTPSLYPDMDVRISFSDFMECKDPVLDAILDYK
jgi:hypothetical protein